MTGGPVTDGEERLSAIPMSTFDIMSCSSHPESRDSVEVQRPALLITDGFKWAGKSLKGFIVK